MKKYIQPRITVHAVTFSKNVLIGISERKTYGGFMIREDNGIGDNDEDEDDTESPW